MDEKELEKLVAKYQKRADTAEQAYQETGVWRCYGPIGRTRIWRTRLGLPCQPKRSTRPCAT